MKMANCLMQLNQCHFPNCSLHFANQYDLSAHIEYTHIPVIEEDVKRKKQAAFANSNGDPPIQPVTMNLPLSYYSRVFRSAYRPNPIKPEPLKVSFNHYKKRSQRDRLGSQNHHAPAAAVRVVREMWAKQGKHMGVEDAEKLLASMDFEECGPENNEVRYRCAMVDCNKRYKNMFALRVHMKVVHSVTVAEDAKSLTNYPPEDVKPNLAALQQSLQQQAQMNHMNAHPVENTSSSGTSNTLHSNGPSTPMAQRSPGVPQNFGNPATNATSFKCSYCAKRYKTSSGLSNHMMSSHQKISDAHDAPSPQVVEQLISQVRMQSQQEQNVDKGPPRTLPSTQGAPQSVANTSRSFSVTTTQQPLRYSQQHYQVNLDNQPSTGQVLQMQMQHQKRMKQMQEQQAQQAQLAAAAQHHQHQQQQQHQQISMQQGQFPSSSMGQMGQGSIQTLPPQSQQNQQMNQMQQQQQYHQIPPQQQQQPQSSLYPQQMHQMVQQSPHPYQQYQQHQSPQFPTYQQPSPQNQQANGPQPQRSPIQISQPLPPLNSITQQRTVQQTAATQNNVPIQFSPPNSQGFNMMPSPSNGPSLPSQPPPYNL